jgi:quercetin dioxygenase-like cupin family protein
VTEEANALIAGSCVDYRFELPAFDECEGRSEMVSAAVIEVDPAVILDNPRVGQRVSVVTPARETEGELLVLESWFARGWGEAGLHYHPYQEERFEVVVGSVWVRVGAQERVCGAGEVVRFPRGVAHAIGNAYAGPTRVRWEVRPALRTQALLEALGALAREGKLTREGKPLLLYVAALARAFDAEVRRVSPPRPLQKAVFAALATVARVGGIRLEGGPLP